MDFSTVHARELKYNFNDHSRRGWMPSFAIPIQIVTTVLLGIRLLNRITTRGQFGLDDILIVFAWIFGTALTGLVLLETYRYGFDKHIWDTPEAVYWKGALVAFCVESVFFWSTCCTKVSVLLFYRRLVVGTYSRRFKWAIWAAIGFVVVYTVVFFIVICTACLPTEAIWRQYDPKFVLTRNYNCGTRSAQIKVAQLVGALSVVTDFYSVMLPATLLMQIRITNHQKIGLFFIFGVGFLVVGAGIARTYYLGRTQAEVYDKSWVAFEVFVASIIECNVAIICACAPSLRSLFGRYFRDLSTRYGSKENSSKSNSKQSSSSDSQAKLEASGAFGTLKRGASNFKAKRASEKNGRLAVKELQKESSFQETHQYGLEAMSPVAQGYGDDLIAAMERGPLGTQVEHHEEKISNKPRFSAPGPGSFIISPSPSISSDDEASLVNKGHSHDGIPYGLPTRDSWGPSLEKQLQQSTGAGVRSPATTIPSKKSWPLPESSRDDRIDTVSQTTDEPTRPHPVRKLTRERWR